MDWDLFISHAFEDKVDVAKPLADLLISRRLKVWYDDYTLKMGDKLRPSIESGLARSRYAVVVLSPNFFAKKWTQLELDALFTLEKLGEERILPVWHNVTASDVEQFSSLMASRLGVSTSIGLEHVVGKICDVVRSGESSPEAVNARKQLHPHSIEILRAAQSGDGTIIALEHSGGLVVQAGGKSMGKEGNPRAEALSRHCLEELQARGLAEDRGEGESLLALTQEGYDYQVPAGVIDAPTPAFPAISAANRPFAAEIVQGAVAADGTVISGGDVLRAGAWNHDSGGDRRIEARWESVLKELTDVGLLLPISETVYLVSHVGFLWADAMSVRDAVKANGS